MGTKDFEMGIECEPASRGSPWTVLDIASSIAEEIEVGQKSTCGSGPLLRMAGYSSLWVGYKLFFQVMDLNVGKVEYIKYI